MAVSEPFWSEGSGRRRITSLLEFVPTMTSMSPGLDALLMASSTLEQSIASGRQEAGRLTNPAAATCEIPAGLRRPRLLTATSSTYDINRLDEQALETLQPGKERC
jgi:hypothetical protein